MSKRLAILFVVVLLAAGRSPAFVATTSYSAGDEGPNPKAVQIAQAQGGHLLTVKLAGLAKDTTVHRARLRAARGRLDDPADLLAEIEIYPGKAAAGKALALAGPADDAFDATAAVSQALQAGGELALFVKAFPGWQQDSTRLEVTYAGRPKMVPSAAGGLNVFHRAGQTFVTWKEVDPLITADKATWGEVKAKLADAAGACTYRIYRHSQPITADTILQAELLAEVAPLSCWNVNGRNMEYLIGQAMIQPDEIGELARNYGGYMYTWGMDHPRMDRYPLARFVIDPKAPPLAPGTGLYVHTPAKAGQRYYAVVTSRGGVENTIDFSPANALAKPVEETVGPGEPVHQGPGLHGPFFDYPGRRQVYVQWCGPGLCPRQNMYFNWTALVPPGLKKDQKAPLELYFHSGNFSYAKPRKKFMLDSIQIATHDHPDSGWYGFNDAFGTLKSYKAGTVGNHTQRRIVAFLEWAKKTFPIDPDRIVLPGSDGAALLALNYPDLFAYVLINNFSNTAVWKERSGPLNAAWGPRGAEIKDDRGRGDWGWAMLDKLVLAARGRDLPLFVCRGYSWAPFVRAFARGEGLFYKAMRDANQPLVADWTWASGQLVAPDKHTGLWRGLDVTRTTPLPAYANCSLDRNTEGDGQTNLRFGWKPIDETAESVELVTTSGGGEASFDLSFRRLQRFKPKPGETLRWQALSKPGRQGVEAPPPQSGTVAVEADGLFVIKGLKNPGSATLTVKVARAKGG